MNKRIIATLVAASFAGLMLTSPSFATDAQNAQSTSGSSTSAQAAASGTGPRESYQTGSTTPRKRGSPEDLAAAEREAAASDRSNDSGTRNKSASDGAASSQKAEAAAKAEYKAAIEKCEAQPTEQRSACVQDAEKAQILASRDEGASSGTPQSRSMERADKNAGEPRESHRSGTSKPSKADSEEDRATARAQDKAVASANAKAEANAEYNAALEKCESKPIGQRSACVQDAEAAQTLAMQQSRDGTSSSAEPQESHRTGTSKPAKPDASDKRATERAQDKVVASAKAETDAKTDAETEYKAAVGKCDSLPIEQRSPCVQDAEKVQTLARQQSQEGTPASTAPKSPIPGPQSAK